MVNNPTSRLGISLATVLVMVFGLAACSDKPDPVDAEFTAQFDQLSQQIDAVEAMIEKEEDTFKSALEDPKYTFVASLSPKDQHADRYEQARTKLEQFKALLNDEARPMATNLQPVNRAVLEQMLVDVQAGVDGAKELAMDPNTWLSSLLAAKTDPEKLKSSVGIIAETATSKYAPVGEIALSAKDSFPQQSEYIDQKLAELTKMQDSMNSAVVGMAPLGANDFLKLASLATAATSSASALTTLSAEFDADLQTLPSSMTITLLDVKLIFTVSMMRSSWDESVDGGEEELVYPAKEVSAATGNVIASLSDNDVVAREIESDGKNLSVYIDQVAWNELGIGNSVDAIKAGAPGSHNHFEIYVNDWDETACQQVRELVDGMPATTERPNPTDICAKYDTEADLANGIYWQEADELRTDAIGMDIYAKAAGDFDDQAIETATPPGMVYVGDPAYGEWRDDDNGNSYWYYYGQYRFFSDLIGGPYPYHYRSEYNTWNSSYRPSGKPYYAPDANGTPRYGANSPLVTSRFPNSNYTRDGLAQATVRNSGAVARAGGPGGGGK